MKIILLEISLRVIFIYYIVINVVQVRRSPFCGHVHYVVPGTFEYDTKASLIQLSLTLNR